MRASRLAVLAFAATLAAGPALAAAPLISHRAVYDLALDKASDKSGITGLQGRMVYEFNGSPCEGYTVNFRFVTRIDTGENSRVTDLRRPNLFKRLAAQQCLLHLVIYPFELSVRSESIRALMSALLRGLCVSTLQR